MSSSKPSQESQQSTNNDFQSQMEKLLQLVTNRSNGRVDDDLVEDAVSSLLKGGNNSSHDCVVASGEENTANANANKLNNLQSNADSKSPTRKRAAMDTYEDIIIEDEDDYDNLDNEEIKEAPKGKRKKGDNEQVTKANNINETLLKPTWTGPKVSIEQIEKQEKILKQNERDNKRKLNQRNKNHKEQLTMDLNETWKKLEDIPLGRIGAKMMVTFGDNVDTDPQALTAALHGTRLCLQNAIKDARALRRKMKHDYNRAKVMVNLHKAKRKERSTLREEADVPLSDNVDPNMLFKAIDGYDKITFDPKCGFDATQLEKLFPEEMNAYRRWRKMHKSYTDSKEDSKERQNYQQQEGQEESNKTNDNDSDDELEVMADQSQSKQTSTVAKSKDKTHEWGGHLNDRMAQFDARTDRMKEEWYLTFSVVRQGSFLSKSYQHTEWEKARKQKQGRRKATWENLPPSYVQFLHWIGFDHESALPPPNGETTEALAFLGYDFMGKIIEKAIFLRCLDQRLANRGKSTHNEKIILELEGGEQLSKKDIERALDDSTIGAKPLYFATNSVLENGSAVQLYFGPGFEDRVEMELEQMVMCTVKGSKVTEEENKIRQEEDVLFDKIKAPPSQLENYAEIMSNKLSNEPHQAEKQDELIIK